MLGTNFFQISNLNVKPGWAENCIKQDWCKIKLSLIEMFHIYTVERVMGGTDALLHELFKDL